MIVYYHFFSLSRSVFLVPYRCGWCVTVKKRFCSIWLPKWKYRQKTVLRVNLDRTNRTSCIAQKVKAPTHVPMWFVRALADIDKIAFDNEQNWKFQAWQSKKSIGKLMYDAISIRKNTFTLMAWICAAILQCRICMNDTSEGLCETAKFFHFFVHISRAYTPLTGPLRKEWKTYRQKKT